MLGLWGTRVGGGGSIRGVDTPSRNQPPIIWTGDVLRLPLVCPSIATPSDESTTSRILCIISNCCIKDAMCPYRVPRGFSILCFVYHSLGGIRSSCRV